MSPAEMGAEVHDGCCGTGNMLESVKSKGTMMNRAGMGV